MTAWDDLTSRQRQRALMLLRKAEEQDAVDALREADRVARQEMITTGYLRADEWTARARRLDLPIDFHVTIEADTDGPRANLVARWPLLSDHLWETIMDRLESGLTTASTSAEATVE